MNRKKISLLKMLLAFPLGMAIGQLCSLIASTIYSIILNQDQYLAVPVSLTNQFHNELVAVYWQTFWCGILGVIFEASRVIWQKEAWSLLKRSFIYYLVTSSATLLVASLNHWIILHLLSFGLFLISYTIIFMIIWVIVYLRIYFLMKQWNQKL